MSSSSNFLPASPRELWDAHPRGADVLLVTGDAYVDHPSFGAAVVGRLLRSWGLAVAMAPQPDWHDPAALEEYGRPRLFVGITAGNMDSMVNHQTAFRRRRRHDAYSPGGEMGRRPNRASVVYAQLARRAFGDALVVLGGVEASLRRFAHYDYWSDELRRSVLLDSRADVLVYGMAERPLRAICDRLAGMERVSRGALSRLLGIRGTTVVITRRQARSWAIEGRDGERLRFGPHGREGRGPSLPARGLFRDPPRPVTFTVSRLPAHDRIQEDPGELARASRLVERASNPALGLACVQRHKDSLCLTMPPAWPLSTTELDAVHELPYARAQHPSYTEPIPAFTMICSSVQITRGCFGGCSFCAIGLHEGRAVQSRSAPSVLREIEQLQRLPTFRGTITDLGGPTANTYGLGCSSPAREARCRRPSCLHPRPCPLLVTDHTPLRALLAQVRHVSGVRHAFIASGIRHDLALQDPGFLEDLVRHHVGGHLHVAPEHSDPEVLRLARKPPYEVFERFREAFRLARRRAGLERYLNPYFISGLPGSDRRAMAALARLLRAEGWRPRQVQAFLPTPGSVSTAMFFAGRNPDRLAETVHTPRTIAQKRRQHDMLTEGLPDTR